MFEQKAYPYPEIVTGDQWHVTETTESDPKPRTDNLNKQMYVPMDRDCDTCGVNHSRLIRRHELGHAKWSPKTIGKLMRGTRSDCIETLENVRINYLLAKVGKLGIDNYTECEMIVKSKALSMIYNSSIADIILFTLNQYAVFHVGSYTEKAEHFREIRSVFVKAVNEDTELSSLRKAEIKFALNIVDRFIQSIETHAWNKPPSYRKVQKLAEQLSQIIEQFIDKPNPDDVKAKPKTSNEKGESEEGESEEIDSSSSVDSTVDQLEKRMRRQLIEEMQYHSTTGVGRWGKMQIHTPPLSVNLQGRLKNSRAYRASDFGYNPKYINRYCIDKKIFKQKQTVKGGTILIDASGSMSLRGQDILDIMQLLPAVNIAMYNGSYNTGDLRIIAKNGKRVDDNYLIQHTGRGNVVDGPALEWLATMPARRIWVSDMMVFGASGANASGFNLLQDCYKLCTKHKIINLKNIDEVKEHALKLNTVL